MEIRIKGIGVEIVGGDDLDNAQESEYGFTEIQSITVTDDEENEIYSAENADDFKQEASFDLDFNEMELVRIDTETMEYVWWDIEEWDPEKLTVTTHVFNTPTGDITVLAPEYDDEYEEMKPDFLMSSVVYENGEEVERYEN